MRPRFTDSASLHLLLVLALGSSAAAEGPVSPDPVWTALSAAELEARTPTSASFTRQASPPSPLFIPAPSVPFRPPPPPK